MRHRVVQASEWAARGGSDPVLPFCLVFGYAETVDGKARPKLPVTVGLLAEIREQLELSEHNHLVAWAVLTMGVFGMFRLGELLPEGDKSLVLGENSVLWVNAGHAQVMLKASKTDPFREGVCVNLFAQLEDTVCPLAALRAVLAGRPAAMAGKPLFTLSLGSVMTRAQLVEVSCDDDRR